MLNTDLHLTPSAATFVAASMCGNGTAEIAGDRNSSALAWRCMR